jgi:hypothetical protein
VAQDLEPEYITVSSNSKKAWITLQENNAIAVLDIGKGKITELIGLGFKDHDSAGNGMDASDEDGEINIDRWPAKGMFLPDGIDFFEASGERYLITANEGDAREYECFEEETRVEDLTLDSSSFSDISELQQPETLGRLTVTLTNGDSNKNGEFEELYSFGGRSFSIWSNEGQMVFDSGDDFEKILEDRLPDYFNADNAENGPDTFDSRSDNKGPEPESVVAQNIFGRVFAFIGLERIGGIMVYDVTNPESPDFEQYVNNRDFDADIESEEAGDLGPEGLIVIKKSDSPNSKPLLVVANEISGTTTVYEIRKISG